MAEISRRALLSGTMLVAGAGVGAVLGFGRTVHHKHAVPPPQAPAALTAALARQRALLAGYATLLAGYDRLPAARPRFLASLREDVHAQLDALLALLQRYPGWRLAELGPSGSASASPSMISPVPSSTAALAASSSAAATALVTACVHWPIGEPNAAQVVPVLGSIAAGLSSHALVLASERS